MALTLIYTYDITASIAVLCKHAVKAGKAVWSPVPHDVPLTSELKVALKTGKVFHVPGTALSLCAFIREYDLKGKSC